MKKTNKFIILICGIIIICLAAVIYKKTLKQPDKQENPSEQQTDTEENGVSTDESGEVIEKDEGKESGNIDILDSSDSNDGGSGVITGSSGISGNSGNSGIVDHRDDSGNFAIASVEIPDYSGDAYIEINNGMPYFTEEEKKITEPFERYSDLDELGRCGAAYANICQDLMPSEKRGNIGDIKPTGWKQEKYPGIVDSEPPYLYNRSHLIAYSLAGENSNEKNLITGTRYFNQEIMQIFELKVLDYVRDTDNHVLYRVTPVFEGDNLLAKGVEMEAWSVEDGGKGICFNVFCYNVEPFIDIDYATGASKISEDYRENDTVPDTEGVKIIDISESGSENADEDFDRNVPDKDFERNVPDEETSQESTENRNFEDKVTDFVINTNSGKIHTPDCNSVKDMADQNKWEYTGTLRELKEKGYVPCARCLGDYR